MERLLSLNPHIQFPDKRIPGFTVYLPSANGQPSETTTDTPMPPTCPADTSAKPLYHWFPLTPLEDVAAAEYDVLIIGTGAGGGAALWRLCEKWKQQRKRIGIIERGNLLLPTHARNLPMMNTDRLTRFFRTASTPLPGADPHYPGARQLFAAGGRTLFWYAFAIRMNLSVLSEWPVPAEEMESYYSMAEQFMNVSRAFTEDATFTEILLNRLWQNGYSNAAHIPLAADLVPSVYGRIHTDVFSSSISFLSAALNIRPFDLAVNARAVEILHHQGKATGVKVMSPDKTAYTIKAKTIVVSASTFETPRLLLHSGIQNPALGHYLMNHSFVQAAGSIDRRPFPFPLGTLGIMIPSTVNRPYLVLMAGPGNFYWHQIRPFSLEESVLFFAYGKAIPRYENVITLNPYKRDDYGVPEINVHYTRNEEELDTIHRITEGIRHIASVAGIHLKSRDGNPSICLTPTGDLHHDSGTCRIGYDPSTSAADPYGQVRGITGLFVADNSVLPFIGSENPTLTTVALAIRTADYIAGRQS